MLNALPEFANLDQRSPTLDLTNDCFQFVTGFFEVISTSAPHIYHSALILSPKTSILQKLYRPLVHSLARVVQGVPTSWGPSIANSNYLAIATWSPCSRFIAIHQDESPGVVVLDGATLKQLYTVYSQNKESYHVKLVFSPDVHSLTGYAYATNRITSWDLQTGGEISEIRTKWSSTCNSMSYSGNGAMLGALFDQDTIIIYSVLSGTQIYSHSVPKSVVKTIWTHGEYLHFGNVESESITIWEISFTSGNAPTQIDSLPTPDNFSSNELVLLPILSQLAFIFQGRIVVWDAQHLSGFRLPPNQNSGCPDDQPNIRAPGDDNQTTEMCWNISKN